MNDLQRIKANIDVVGFLSEYIELKKAGRNFKALCPFHSEKTPSFVVSPERQSWHCFGACNEGGDIFDFLMKWEHIEFSESIKILAQKAGVTLSSYQPTEGTKEKERLYEMNHLASEYYHYILANHPLGKKALEYIKNRDINDKIINTFALGYAPDSWDSILKFLKKKKYQNEEIISSGLVIRSERGTIYDRFRGRLMFTLRNHRGNFVGFSGRKIDNGKSLPAGRQEAKYINTPETPVYKKGDMLYGLDITHEAIRKEGSAIIVEGEFDFLSSFQVGVANIVAIKGSAFTDGQIHLLKRYTENIILSLDSDFAGSQAAKKGIESAEKAGLSLHIVNLPYGKDPDECIKKDPSLWKNAVKKAVPIYDFLIDKAFLHYDSNNSSDKKKIGDSVIPFLAEIENPIILSHYVRLLAQKLSVSEESIESLVENRKQKRDIKSVLNPPDKSTPQKREDIVEEYLLTLALVSPSFRPTLDLIFNIIDIPDITLPPIATIFSELIKYGKKHDSLDVQLLTSALPQEVLPTFDRAYLKDPPPLLNDEKSFHKEVEKIARMLKVITLRRRINLLTTKLKEKGSNEKEHAILTNQLKEIVGGLRDLENQPPKGYNKGNYP